MSLRYLIFFVVNLAKRSFNNTKTIKNIGWTRNVKEEQLMSNYGCS